MSTLIQRPTIKTANPADSIRFKLASFILAQMLNKGSVELCCRRTGLKKLIGKSNGEGLQFRLVLDHYPVLWRMLRNPDPGLGESYMAGDWDLKFGDLGEFLILLGRGRDLMLSSSKGALLRHLMHKKPPKFGNGIQESYANVQHHYDIGNDLYTAFLDSGMNYSCAFFKYPQQSLREAQLNKIHTAIQRLDVMAGMRVLDIGCGWGETSRLLSMESKAEVTGITLARNQIAHAEAASAGSASQPRYLLQDYREHAAQHPAYYDRIISIGMVEHVGKTELAVYFRAIMEQLKPGGRALVHSIVRSGKPATVKLSSPWLSRYIFPGGHIPEVDELVHHAQAQGLVLRQAPFIHESFHYAETLRRWRQNFLANFSQLDPMKYDRKFKRMWTYYYCMCEGMFEGCGFRVTQIVLEKPCM